MQRGKNSLLSAAMGFYNLLHSSVCPWTFRLTERKLFVEFNILINARSARRPAPLIAVCRPSRISLV